ncbi:MAG: sugar dehydrogenase complex small subunit [Aromatoleum sp.]|jgi:hypothetical protein|uniref:sugar dehydrogenase complex small subunit n=1 Tax=Aromatoleum sp. TaxID=2307007 RepID=UPI0028943692|nr:sugar dehydrogenase complex small subunit [Aromatoleum sp.]MDT3672157.1 sugar dehydrogenase complex small subunit [Aromatoleum sp.]
MDARVDDHDHPMCQGRGPLGRGLLIGLAGAYVTSPIPKALAQPADDKNRGAFLAVSASRVARNSLDAVQAKRLYDALIADDPGFPAAARALPNFIPCRARPRNEVGLFPHRGSRRLT